MDFFGGQDFPKVTACLVTLDFYPSRNVSNVSQMAAPFVDAGFY